MASTLFRLRYWFTNIAILAMLIAVVILFFKPLYDLPELFLISSYYFILIGLAIVVILNLVNSVLNFEPEFSRITQIISLIYLTLVGVIFLNFILASNYLVAILLGCIVVSMIKGSIKTSNQIINKESKTKRKNVICDIILIILYVIFITLISIKKEAIINYFTITSFIILGNSIADLIFVNINSSQQNRPYLSTKNIVQTDSAATFKNKVKKVSVEFSKSINIILFYLVISTFGIIILLILKVTFNEAAFAEKPSGLTFMFFFQFLLLGLLLFFEIYIHVPVERFQFLHKQEEKVILILNNLKKIYKQERETSYKIIFLSFISSLFLIIGSIFIQLIFTLSEESNWNNLGFSGKHFVNFLNVLYFPLVAAIFIIVVITILLGLLTVGWFSRKPISGILAGFLTSWFYSIGIILVDSDSTALLTVALVVCPIFGFIGGFLNFQGRGIFSLKTRWKENTNTKKVNEK